MRTVRVIWHCQNCGAENSDHIGLTGCPICWKCDLEIDWWKIPEANTPEILSEIREWEADDD